MTSALQRRYLPSHYILRSFEAAARHNSFTLAAEELHLTQSAISRQVKELEDLIGTKLFRRAGRRVALTLAGKRFAEELAVDLDNLNQTLMRAISAGREGSTIRMAVLPGFTTRWLMPRLSEFSELHPNIELRMSTRLEPFDMSRQRFDLAIHFGTDDWPGTKMRPLRSETMVAVASPSFKQAHQIESAEQLLNVPLLHMETRPIIWRQFFEKANVEGNILLAGKYFDQFEMIIGAAVESLGAALVPTYLIEKELSVGALVQLSETALTTQNHYYLVAPNDRENVDAEVFSNWLMSKSEPIFFDHTSARP